MRGCTLCVCLFIHQPSESSAENVTNEQDEGTRDVDSSNSSQAEPTGVGSLCVALDAMGCPESKCRSWRCQVYCARPLDFFEDFMFHVCTRADSQIICVRTTMHTICLRFSTVRRTISVRTHVLTCLYASIARRLFFSFHPMSSRSTLPTLQSMRTQVTRSTRCLAHAYLMPTHATLMSLHEVCLPVRLRVYSILRLSQARTTATQLHVLTATARTATRVPAKTEKVHQG